MSCFHSNGRFGQNYKQQCFKITTKGHGVKSVNYQDFRVQWALKFNHSLRSQPFRIIEVTLTSEENSYGLAGRKWYDGYVKCLFGGDDNALYKFIEVTEYLKLDSK